MDRPSVDVGSAGAVLVRTTYRTAEFQQQVATALDEHFSRLGINVASTDILSNIRQANEAFFNTIIFALLVMALLIAVVGGLGLMGTMSLNVIERIREIGVMRAIGASDGTILQVIMVEGMMLGLLSWALGALLSFPMSQFLSDQVGRQLFSLPLSFSFAVEGAIIWLVFSLVLASVASFFPAWRASRVTVRDVLAYE
ncbi:MAG: FtsX-like permease family protein [Chloroflexaceae bacterium]|nr:FtsX-like permease family protein [Chloroflexaceae bacterium]